jgi:hypothetical protein
MAKKPEIKLSVMPSDKEEWVLDGGVNVSRRFDFQSIDRRPSKLLPRDMATYPADNRKPL